MHRCSCSTNNIDGVKMNIEIVYGLIIAGYVGLAIGGFFLGKRIGEYSRKRKERKEKIMTWGESK